MYNYQTYLKENKVNRKFQQIKKQYYDEINHRQKINASLINSHKKRIEGFILAMVEKPNPIHLYQDQHYEPRSLQKTHSIHQKSFCHNNRTHKERIQQTSQKNSFCDPVPFHNTFSHRFRDYKDQSQLKPMRYTSINGSLRVKQHLDSSTLNYLPNVHNRKIDNLAKNPKISWKDKDYTRQVNKSLIPSMHRKNYFQSLKSMFSDSPTAFLNNMPHIEKYEKQTPINKTDEYDEQTDIDPNTKKEKKSNGQSMNRKQNSRQALIKCGLLGGKNTAYRIGMQKTCKKVFPESQTQKLRF